MRPTRDLADLQRMKPAQDDEPLGAAGEHEAAVRAGCRRRQALRALRRHLCITNGKIVCQLHLVPGLGLANYWVFNTIVSSLRSADQLTVANSLRS